MQTDSRRLGRLGAVIRRFTRAHRGAAAVEFALVSIPFFALTFAIVDLGLVYFMSVALENATNLAAREIRTGQLQTGGSPSASSFKTLVCSHLTWLGTSCTSNLSVYVQTYTTFNSVTNPNPVTSGQMQSQSSLPFNTGGAGNIVLVQTYYPWKILAPTLDMLGTSLSNGDTVLTSSAVFRNEPYSNS